MLNGCEERNLQYSNPTIGWAKKHIEKEGAVYIHTYIRPDLSKSADYEWGTVKLDKEEFQRRTSIVNKLIEEAKFSSELEDDDLLEELF